MANPTYLPTDPPDPVLPPVSNDPGLPGGGSVPVAPVQTGPTYYRESNQDGRYEWDPGVIQCPVAGPVGTPCELLRLHGGAAKRIVNWTAERVGAQPQVPSPLTQNPNEVTGHVMVMPCTPAFAPDGTPFYRLSGRYEYYLVVAPEIGTDRLSSGGVPYMNIANSSLDVQPNQFDVTLSDSSSSIPQGYGYIVETEPGGGHAQWPAD